MKWRKDREHRQPFQIAISNQLHNFRYLFSANVEANSEDCLFNFIMGTRDMDVDLDLDDWTFMGIWMRVHLKRYRVRDRMRKHWPFDKVDQRNWPKRSQLQFSALAKLAKQQIVKTDAEESWEWLASYTNRIMINNYYIRSSYCYRPLCSPSLLGRVDVMCT